jgi:NAD(P)H-flavin reductase
LLHRGLPPSRLFLSMERNMQCAVGRCGHCQFGGAFVCRDGPVFSWNEAKPLLAHRGF